MDAGMFYIQQESRRYESRCLSAVQLVNRAQTMWEVKRAADVIAPSILRGLQLNRQGAGRQLKSAAEAKMTDLLARQMAAAKDITDIEERQRYLGKLRANEWDALRGDFARLYQQADRAAQQLLAKT